MAEIAEVLGKAEEAGNLDPEEKEELEKDVAEAKESVSCLWQVVDAIERNYRNTGTEKFRSVCYKQCLLQKMLQ